MAKASEVSIDELRDTMRYDTETGKLFWTHSPHRNEAWNKRFPGREAFTYTHKDGYKVGIFSNAHLKAHRVIWAIVYGEWPLQVDHINGDRADNRIQNLRSVTAQENARNRGLRSDNKAGVTGVCWDRKEGKWIAQLTVDGRNRRLGAFNSKDDAAAAWRDAFEKQDGFHPDHGTRVAYYRSQANKRHLSRVAQRRREVE